MKTILFRMITLLIMALPSTAAEFKRVALVAVSTQYDAQKEEEITNRLTKAGYLVTKKHLHQVVSDFGYVNTDQSRAKNLVDALLNNDIDIIWFVRGGGGSINLLPYLHDQIPRLKSAKPKVLIGFSDVTAIHSFVNEYLKWQSLHAVVASYNKDMKSPDDKTISTNDLEPLPSVNKIFNDGVSYENVIPLNQLARNGVTGELRGGNLTVTAATFATKFQPDYSGKMLLLEDVGISFRQLDRSLQQLLFMNALDVNAIVFGQFYPADPTDEQRLIYKSVITQFANRFDKPVYYYPFIGHGRINKPVVLGAMTSLVCHTQSEYCTFRQSTSSLAR